MGHFSRSYDQKRRFQLSSLLTPQNVFFQWVLSHGKCRIGKLSNTRKKQKLRCVCACLVLRAQALRDLGEAPHGVAWYVGMWGNEHRVNTLKNKKV